MSDTGSLKPLVGRLNTLRFLVGVRVTRSLVLCVCFVDRFLSFFFCQFRQLCCLILLRFTDSDYPFSLVSSNSSGRNIFIYLLLKEGMNACLLL